MNNKIFNATEKECEFLDDKIVEYNNFKVPFTQETSFERINKVIKDNDGKIIAGIQSILYCWNCLHIDILWVEEDSRASGIGTFLLGEVEKLAKTKGCNLVHLDTFDFQGKDFYLRQGYKIFGELQDCPKSHTRYFMSKVI